MAETAATNPLLTNRFQQAFDLAAQVHGKQVRKGTQIPYLAHLMSVAALVLEYGGGEDAAIGGLLHDAVEDAADGTVMEHCIREQFGNHVTQIVAGCSDTVAVPGMPKPAWPERKTTYLKRLATESDLDVLLVSACDKLHNARSIVADLRVLGSRLWGRFTQADPAAQLWYYQVLAACYHERIPPALDDELSRTVAQMQSLAAQAEAREMRASGP